MPGTREGGLKAAKTNKERYGSNFYKEQGRKGGTVSTGGGFAKDRELAKEAGRLGGLKSKRGKAKEPEQEVYRPGDFHS